MKTAVKETEAVTLPRFASCLTHGRYGAAHDARTGCPFCRQERQSVTRYGLSNSIGAPLGRATGNGQRATVIVLAVIVSVLLTGFFLIVRSANQRLDRAVLRIERASR